MNKACYEEVRMEIIEFSHEDVIITSDIPGNETEDDVFG